MNDLFFVRYEARRMLVDSMDMPPDVELAHRRLCDFVWAMDGPPDDDVTILVSITRSTPHDWVRVRGGLERKGWHVEDKKFTHNGAVKTLMLGKEAYTSALERTKAATEARLAKRNVQRNVSRDEKRNQMQSESESESDSTEGRKEGEFPTLDDVKTRASMTGMPEEDAIAFWNHFESTGWIDKNGHRIKKWKSKMDNWKCQSRSVGGNGHLKPKSVLDLKTTLEAKRTLSQSLRSNHCRETGLDEHWTSNEKRDEYYRLKKEEKELTIKLSNMA